MEIIRPERLNEQKNRVREIRRLQKEIDIISEQLSSPQGVHYSDMPKNRNPFDKIGMLISRKIEKLWNCTNRKGKFCAVPQDFLNIPSRKYFSACSGFGNIRQAAPLSFLPLLRSRQSLPYSCKGAFHKGR